MKLLIKMLILSAGLISSVAFGGGAIVVAPGSSIGGVDKTAVERVFLGQAREIGGVSVTPVNQSEGQAVREQFEERVLGMTSSRVRSHWSRLIFTGAAQPPQNLGGDADVKNFVAGNPNAIGYISADSVDASVRVVLEF